jgi:hypothetical protein
MSDATTRCAIEDFLTTSRTLGRGTSYRELRNLQGRFGGVPYVPTGAISPGEPGAAILKALGLTEGGQTTLLSPATVAIVRGEAKS